MSDSIGYLEALQRALDAAIAGMEQAVVNGEYTSRRAYDAIQLVVATANVLAKLEAANGERKATE